MRANLNSKRILSLIALTLLHLGGCFGDGKVKVGGTVNVGGEPVVQGTIRFAPADGIGPTDGATIDAGRYSATVLPGNKTVQIEAFKKVGEAPHDRNDPSSPVLPVYDSLTKFETTADIRSASDTLNFEVPAPTK